LFFSILILVEWIGVGVCREDMIDLKKEFKA
jgi:hypothetical protein